MVRAHLPPAKNLARSGSSICSQTFQKISFAIFLAEQIEHASSTMLSKNHQNVYWCRERVLSLRTY